MKATIKSSKKQQKKRLILTAFALSAAGVLGYFGWQYFKKKKAGSGKNASDLDDILKNLTPSPDPAIDAGNDTPTKSIKPKRKSSSTEDNSPNTSDTSVFPLKKGSKGEKVKELQEALIAKHGSSILPKYGADGDFGSETANALKKVGLPATVSLSMFNVLVQGAGNTNTSGSIGQQLFNATSARNFNQVLLILQQIKNTSDYTGANDVFKNLRLGGGVRQTIVNGLLNTFTRQDQKEKIKYEFLRIGLEYDGKKWILSGLDGLPIMTIIPTTVWVNGVKGVHVPARMVLGKAVNRRLDYTLFCNRGKYFLVQTKCIKHL